MPTESWTDWAPCPACTLPMGAPAKLHPRGSELGSEFRRMICMDCGHHWLEEDPEVVAKVWAGELWEERNLGG